MWRNEMQSGCSLADRGLLHSSGVGVCRLVGGCESRPRAECALCQLVKWTSLHIIYVLYPRDRASASTGTMDDLWTEQQFHEMLDARKMLAASDFVSRSQIDSRIQADDSPAAHIGRPGLQRHRHSDSGAAHRQLSANGELRGPSRCTDVNQKSAEEG